MLGSNTITFGMYQDPTTFETRFGRYEYYTIGLIQRNNRRRTEPWTTKILKKIIEMAMSRSTLLFLAFFQQLKDKIMSMMNNNYSILNYVMPTVYKLMTLHIG